MAIGGLWTLPYLTRIRALSCPSCIPNGDRNWLWVMANPQAAYLPIHPPRSKAAFAQRIADWRGILVSAGYLVYQHWQGLRRIA